MSTPIDTKPANRVATLVSFEWGADPTVRRYAIWASDVTFEGNVYTAVPTMELDYGKQDGSTKESPSTLAIAKSIEPLDKMAGTFPPVAVTVRELRPGLDSSARIMRAGRISRVSYNYNGNAGLVRATIVGHKQSLDTSVSLIVGRLCPWSFGDYICGMDLSTVRETATVAAISGNRVTLTGLSTVNRAGYWKFGEILVDGFPISIHHHDVNTQVIYLVKPPPAYWLGRSASLVPGCDKTLAACSGWGRTSRFCGLGIKIPNREVRIEE